MIKFFRKIRYNLMEQNKTAKYFKYAIGEIVLVVIGILIALSINNWNENRKIAKQEFQIVNKMTQQTLADSILLSKRIDALKMFDSLYNYYIAINKGTSDALPDRKFYGSILSIHKMNNGSNLIRNHSEDFKTISNLELREQHMHYSYLVTMMDGAIALYNQNLQDLIIPLEVKYYEALKPFDTTATLSQIKNALKTPEIESNFTIIKRLNQGVFNQIEILETHNKKILNDLRAYNNQFKQ